jgi:hypothetical protein
MHANKLPVWRSLVCIIDTYLNTGEHDFDLNLLELPVDGEKEHVSVEMLKTGEKRGILVLSFSRKEIMKGSFEGLLHVTVHRIANFPNKAGILDKTDPYVSVQLGAGKPRKTSLKQNAGGTVDFNETITFTDKGLVDSMLRLSGASLNFACTFGTKSHVFIVFNCISCYILTCVLLHFGFSDGFGHSLG